MPEEKDSVRAAEEARPVDRIGLAFQDGLQKEWELPGVVLEIGVLDDHHVAPGVLEARSQRGPLTLVLLVKDKRIDELSFQLA